MKSLFFIRTKVRPGPDHPGFMEWRFGLLNVWVMAKGAKGAGQRVANILAELGYMVEDDGHMAVDNCDRKYFFPWRSTKYPDNQNAREFGISFELLKFKADVTEAHFKAIEL